jgi:hypothetical protein
MPVASKPVRQTVTLPAPVARKVRAVAQSSRTSTSKVLTALIESGLHAREREKQEFLDLADRLSRTRDPEEQRRLKDELARRTFGV